jgi:hypothetical protein
MLRLVAFIRTDISEELSASFIGMTIEELGTALATDAPYEEIPSIGILVTLMKEVL